MTPSLRVALILFSLAARALALAPACAQDTFYARYNPSFSDAGYITPSLDNAFYGVTRHASGEYLTFYKLDQQGDLVWIKQAPFSPPMFPTRLVALSDGAFAFLAVRNDGTSVTFVFKVDDDGEVLWGRSLDIGSPANFQALAPTTDGGMILTGSGCLGADMIIHLDPDGHILSQHGHTPIGSDYYHPNAMDMVHEGNDQYAYMGYAAEPGNAYVPLAFWRSDSAGTVSSYREFHFPFGTASSWPLGKSIVRSTSGGHYIAVQVDDDGPMVSHVVMLYLNEQDELEWMKDIATTDTLLALSSLCPTDDGGCVIVGNNMYNTTTFTHGTYALKFNEQGDLLWSTLVGDLNMGGWNGWDRVFTQSIAPAANGCMMTVPVRYGGFDFCRVDAEFNGFCYNTPFTPVITEVVPTVLLYALMPTTINFVEGIMPIAPETASYARTNICFTTDLPEMRADHTLSIAPNPASDHFQLSVPNNRPQGATITLTNALGELCHSSQVMALPGQPIVVQFRDLPAGPYIAEVRMGAALQRAKVVVEH